VSGVLCEFSAAPYPPLPPLGVRGPERGKFGPLLEKPEANPKQKKLRPRSFLPSTAPPHPHSPPPTQPTPPWGGFVCSRFSFHNKWGGDLLDQFAGCFF